MPPRPVNDYPQLDERARALLADAVAREGSITATARRLGYARSSVSLALAGRYTADVGKLRARILEAFADLVACPHLGRDIPPADCLAHRTRPMPTASRDALKHWQACRQCPNNTNREDGR